MKEELDKTPAYGTEIISESMLKDELDKTPKFGTEIISEAVIKEELDKTPKSEPEVIPEPVKENSFLQLVSWLQSFNWKKGYIRLAVVLSVILVLWGLAVGKYYDFGYSHYPDFLEPVILGLVVLWVIVPFVLWAVVPLLVYIITWVVSGFTDND